MADKKITLRLKSNPSVVLPELPVRDEYPSGFMVDFPERAGVFMDKDVWEPVPPPYVLPTGIGAVVQDSTGAVFVRVDHANGKKWHNRVEVYYLGDDALLRRGTLTTLSEGVTL